MKTSFYLLAVSVPIISEIPSSTYASTWKILYAMLIKELSLLRARILPKIRRRTTIRMGSSLEVGQTLVGQTGTPYLLQKVLYDRDEGKIRRTVWLALYDCPTHSPLLYLKLSLVHPSKTFREIFQD